MTVVLTDEEFGQLRVLLARAAGLAFDDARRDGLAYSIAERLRATGSRDVAAYLAMVSTVAAERQKLLDEVTIQETHFFRNPPQVRAMRSHILPELLSHADAHGRRLRVWSAGCSTGEEAYSTAMMLRDLLPAKAGWDVKVVATDVSERALAAAREARYGARAVQLATPEEIARFFYAHADGTYQVRPEICEMVELRHHNLVTEPVPFQAGETVDLVLCRNVTIYFSRETTRALIQRLYASLRDGGYLFLGHSETLWQISADFRLVTLGTGDASAFAYRRPGGTPERRAALPDGRAALPDSEPRTASRRTSVWEALARPRVLLPAASRPASLPVVRDALANGRYAEAAELAADLAAGNPMLAEAHYLRGLALVNQRQDAHALLELRKAVYLDPYAGLAHFLLAGVLARLDDAPAAAREYRAAADTLGGDPGDAGAAELGGRSVNDLVILCEQLQGQLAGGEPR